MPRKEPQFSNYLRNSGPHIKHFVKTNTHQNIPINEVQWSEFTEKLELFLTEFQYWPFFWLVFFSEESDCSQIHNSVVFPRIWSTLIGWWLFEQVAGLALIAILLWVRFDPSVAMQLGEDSGPFHTGIYVMIGVAVLIAVVGFLGCCGAVRQSQCLLGTVNPSKTSFFKYSKLLRSLRYVKVSLWDSFFTEHTSFSKNLKSGCMPYIENSMRKRTRACSLYLGVVLNIFHSNSFQVLQSGLKMA